MTIDKDYMYRAPGYGGQRAENCEEWCMTSSYLFRWVRRGIRMDENERITLRLEKENLELMDEFVKGRTSHGNRSQLVRDAVQAYIQTIREGVDTGKSSVPRYHLEMIVRL